MLNEATNLLPDSLLDMQVFQSQITVTRLSYAFWGMRTTHFGGVMLQRQGCQADVQQSKLLWLLTLTTLSCVRCLPSAKGKADRNKAIASKREVLNFLAACGILPLRRRTLPSPPYSGRSPPESTGVHWTPPDSGQFQMAQEHPQILSPMGVHSIFHPEIGRSPPETSTGVQ